MRHTSRTCSCLTQGEEMTGKDPSDGSELVLTVALSEMTAQEMVRLWVAFRFGMRRCAIYCTFCGERGGGIPCVPFLKGLCTWRKRPQVRRLLDDFRVVHQIFLLNLDDSVPFLPR